MKHRDGVGDGMFTCCACKFYGCITSIYLVRRPLMFFFRNVRIPRTDSSGLFIASETSYVSTFGVPYHVHPGGIHERSLLSKLKNDVLWAGFYSKYTVNLQLQHSPRISDYIYIYRGIIIIIFISIISSDYRDRL